MKDQERRTRARGSTVSRYRHIVLAFWTMLSLQVQAETVVTSNIIHRTFHIQWRDRGGTGFSIDHGARQYLVTARHVVEGIESSGTIRIFHDGKWKSLDVKVVGIGDDRIDVAVLACSIRLSPSHPLPATSVGLTYGQSVSFLGYQFGWDAGGEQVNRGVPLPFVKAGIVSAMETDRIFLDAHGNEGFIGGPVVFVPYGQPKNELRVAGIVSHYPIPRLRPVVDRNGDTIAYVTENPGFVVAIDIRHAVKLIDSNPIGFPLTLDDSDR